MKRIFLFLPLLFAFSSSFAQPLTVDLPTVYTPSQTLYISPSGDDSNPGTQLAPMKTFKNALTKITFGTAGVNGGNHYAEVVVLPGHYYPKSNEFAQYDNHWRKSVSGGMVYKNVSIRGVGKVVIHGDSLGTGSQMIYLKGSHIQIKNVTLQNCPLHGISLSGSEIKRHSDVLIDSVVTDSIMGFGILISGYSRVQVEHSTVRNTCRSNERELDGKCQWASGLRTDNCDNVTIKYCTVNNNWGEGINTSLSRTIEVAYNTIYNNYSGNIYCHSPSRGVYRNNLIYNNDSTYWRHCGKKGESSAGISIANELVCTNACPLWTNNCGTKKACCNYTDYDNSVGVNVEYFQIDSIFVYNNIMLDVGISIWDAFSGLGSYSYLKNIYIENNTIIGHTGDVEERKATLNLYLGTSWVDFNNVVIRNNIFSIDLTQPKSSIFSASVPDGICTGTWTNRIKFSNNLWKQLPSVAGVDFSADSVSASLPVQVAFSDIAKLKPSLVHPELLKAAPSASYVNYDYYDSVRKATTNVGAIEFTPDSDTITTPTLPPIKTCFHLSSAVTTDTQKVCVNTAITEIVYSYSVADSIQFVVTGLPVGVTSNFADSGKVMISGSPTVAGVYSYTITTKGNCLDTLIYGLLTIYPSPTATITGDTTVCKASNGVLNIALTGSAPWSFMYGSASGSTLLSGIYANTYTVFASVGTYTVAAVSDSNACSGTTMGSAVISEKLGIVVSNMNTICNTNTSKYIVEFDISGGDTASYVVSGGSGTKTITHFISDSIVSGSPYEFMVTDKFACDSVVVKGTENCGCSATATISGGGVVCEGESAVISIAFSGTKPFSFTYAINDVNQTPVTEIQSSPYTFTTSATGDYTLSNFNDSLCKGSTSGVANVTINPLPVVGSTVNPSVTICSGKTLTLTGTGAYSYTWSDGVVNGQAFLPTTDKTYTVTGTDANGCSNTAIQNVVVLATPNVTNTAVPSSAAVCSGQSVTLTGQGAQTYTWSGGITDGVSFVPTATQTYTVTGTADNNCTGTAIRVVSVFSLPTVGIQVSPSATICEGSEVTLTASGASTYAWSGGINNAVAFSPLATNTYTVVAKNQHTCENSATQNIIVNTCGVGVSEKDNVLQNVVVFPNPNTGTFNIQIKNADFKTLNISLTNTLGEQIFDASDRINSMDYTKEINMEHLPKGMYYLKLKTDTDIKTVKLVIQ